MTPRDVGAVFDAAGEEFAVWSPRLWRPLGEIAVAVGRPRPGERVLDACCGSGASALPAARAVGAHGTVDAVDVAEKLLQQGRLAASQEGAQHLRFVNADVTAWHGDQPYDLVQCCYGVFFFPDTDAGTRHLISLLRPGGRLVVTSWLAGGMARIVPVAREAIAAVRPDVAAEFDRPNASERIDTEAKLRHWLADLGLGNITVDTAVYRQPLHPDDAWSFLRGAALRGLLERLDQGELDAVARRFRQELHRAGMHELDASSIIAVGHSDR
ncbi:class I SAM-dependent methyltransferase [Haloechinothrix sp. LS1_15]|uniref:class I SAM-dependent methyltransferase n=1 Tax=Haloechinothrix sp. LS1_15 TaxID=2652248 RepID=UPI002944A11F|nr:class I SAM-dependent methyltransferase [Haloechinothrix sp. LS1_15]MDV6014608.1 methyltransferase domain-containing protein [Haloechinothrix sp. LS1_15]